MFISCESAILGCHTQHNGKIPCDLNHALCNILHELHAGMNLLIYGISLTMTLCTMTHIYHIKQSRGQQYKIGSRHSIILGAEVDPEAFGTGPGDSSLGSPENTRSYSSATVGLAAAPMKFCYSALR